MATFKITTNSNDVTKRMNRRAVQAGKDVKQLVALSTFLVEATVKMGIQRPPKSGRIYKRRTITHQASAAGEYPASDTGNLVNNISVTIKDTIGRVTSSSKYSKALEYGTTTMHARPFMFPSLEKNKGKILSYFKNKGLLRKTR